MKKTGIIAVLILIFAVGMLWADDEERYTLEVIIHITADLNNIEAWYTGSEGGIYPLDAWSSASAGTPLNTSTNIWPNMETPVTIHASGYRDSSGQFVSTSAPAGNWIYNPVILYLPPSGGDIPVPPPDIPYPTGN